MTGSTACNPLVAVVVPAWNAARTLHDTLQSARAQSYPNLEILVVDDGSTDDTAAIAEAAAADDARVRVLRKANGGLASARNDGVAHASGELIAPLDADDLWHPEKIAMQVAAMQGGGTRLGLVYTWYCLIDQGGRILPRRVASDYRGDVHACLVLHNFIGPGSAPLIRKTCLAEVGGYDEAMRDGCEDLQLYLAIAERYELTVIPRYLVGYRQTATSMQLNVGAHKRAYDGVMARVRQGHPGLPRCLFRWSEAKVSAYMGVNAWRARDFRTGCALFVRALALDPAFPLTLPGRRIPGRVLRWLGVRSGWLEPALGAVGRPFLPPPAGLDDAPAPPLAWLDRRRRAFAARVSVRQPQAGRTNLQPERS